MRKLKAYYQSESLFIIWEYILEYTEPEFKLQNVLWALGSFEPKVMTRIVIFQNLQNLFKKGKNLPLSKKPIIIQYYKHANRYFFRKFSTKVITKFESYQSKTFKNLDLWPKWLFWRFMAGWSLILNFPINTTSDTR